MSIYTDKLINQLIRSKYKLPTDNTWLTYDAVINDVPHVTYHIPTNGTRTEYITLEEHVMKNPNIIAYKYNNESGVTYIKWSDKTETRVRAEDPATADPYTGFMMAIAKKAMGNDNTASNLADYWLVKKPEREAKAAKENAKREAEQKRIEKVRRDKKEKYLIKKEALRLKREYEAKKLATEKYGIKFED